MRVSIYRWTEADAVRMGDVRMMAAPHVGDMITFPRPVDGATGWIVEFVEHLMGEPDGRAVAHSLNVYVHRPGEPANEYIR